MSEGKTYACKSGKVHSGELRLIDRHDGKWFVNSTQLTYVTGQHTYSITMQRRSAVVEDFLLDHAVWVEVRGGLARVCFNGKELQVVEEVKQAIDSWGMCSAKGARNVLWVKITTGAPGTCCLVMDEKYC